MTEPALHRPPPIEPDDEPLPHPEPPPEEDPVPHPDPIVVFLEVDLVCKYFKYETTDSIFLSTRELKNDRLRRRHGKYLN